MNNARVDNIPISWWFVFIGMTLWIIALNPSTVTRMVDLPYYMTNFFELDFNGDCIKLGVNHFSSCLNSDVAVRKAIEWKIFSIFVYLVVLAISWMIGKITLDTRYFQSTLFLGISPIFWAAIGESYPDGWAVFIVLLPTYLSIPILMSLIGSGLIEPEILIILLVRELFTIGDYIFLKIATMITVILLCLPQGIYYLFDFLIFILSYLYYFQTVSLGLVDLPLLPLLNEISDLSGVVVEDRKHPAFLYVSGWLVSFFGVVWFGSLNIGVALIQFLYFGYVVTVRQKFILLVRKIFPLVCLAIVLGTLLPTYFHSRNSIIFWPIIFSILWPVFGNRMVVGLSSASFVGILIIV